MSMLFYRISGGITIAWVEHTVDQIPQIVMLQPFCHKDFAIRSLGDRIKDLNQCVNLYPDTPKDKAFGNYYTPLGGKKPIIIFILSFTRYFYKVKLTIDII